MRRSAEGSNWPRLTSNAEALGTVSGGPKEIKENPEAMEKHFMPRRNIIFESFKFNSRKQEPGETVQQYVQELQKLADTCEFEGLHDRLIRDRLVIGIREDQTRTRLLRTGEIELAKAIEMCKAAELTQLHMKELSQAASTEELASQVNFVKKPKNLRAAVGKRHNCRYCGENHKYGNCPAYGVRCQARGKRNHFAQVCR